MGTDQMTASNETLQRASLLLLGVGLLALSAVNVLVSDADLWLRLVESGLPIGLALFFLVFAVHLYERGESPEAMVVITAWAFAGGLVTGALAVWLLAVITLQGEVISDPSYVVASSATVGATFGGAAGYYHAQLRETASQLQRQNMRLDEFASILSHDLRNPLSVAASGMDLAKQTGREEDFERVKQAHERMDRMIAELLKLSRQGADLSDLEPVSLREVAEGASETVAADLQADIAFRFPDDTKLRADPERLAAVFENLFRNAGEHAGSEPTVTVGAFPDGAGFYVADDGPGIPPDEREDVFDQGYTTDAQGTGIGLAIVRRVADAHGWDVSVTESEAGGARFEFYT
ncbi:sensor histidine kinase [Halorarius halobius]|uniref:sensor histidine kinase n=1 Tax=Halorarius halobius TaxID=2962671 RepID=UPI0020CCA09A|nr:HAMP domain-containing sensor histidine kinase [Halorarius halobius]